MIPASTTAIRFHLNGYKYFPYELRFAAREIATVCGKAPQKVKNGFIVAGATVDVSVLRRLTYVEAVTLPDGSTIRTDQALLEASGGPPTGRVKRQSTRYSAHGIHEYRGKFNPQVVRAVGNMLGVKTGAWILDPFCGSGTTLLESLHAGWNAAGVDLNPLAIAVAQSKLVAWSIPANILDSARQEITDELTSRVAELSFEDEWTERTLIAVGGANWLGRLPNQDYLSSWVRPSALVQLSAILETAGKFPEPVSLLFKVIASDLVRKVSLQDPADLRIRRRKNSPPNHPVIPMFLDAVSIQFGRIIRARQRVLPRHATQAAMVGDSRQSLDWLRPMTRSRSFDAIITSPPYVTALPYIDTQRLSLCLLNLANAAELHSLDRGLTGSRELQPAVRRQLETEIEAHPPEGLPTTVINLSRRMARLFDPRVDGFRRRNVPALTYKYFSDLAATFRSVSQVSRRGAPFALVVGPNRTQLGGVSISIDTPRLLAETARENGWILREILAMDAYSRFDIHSSNSIRSESLVILERE